MASATVDDGIDDFFIGGGNQQSSSGKEFSAFESSFPTIDAVRKKEEKKTPPSDVHMALGAMMSTRFSNDGKRRARHREVPSPVPLQQLLTLPHHHHTTVDPRKQKPNQSGLSSIHPFHYWKTPPPLNLFHNPFSKHFPSLCQTMAHTPRPRNRAARQTIRLEKRKDNCISQEMDGRFLRGV